MCEPKRLYVITCSKVTSKGQITIPKEIREKHNIEKGDYLYFLTSKQVLILSKQRPPDEGKPHFMFQFYKVK